MSVTQWELPGARDRPIRGSTHMPTDDVVGVIVIVHGYKGYKDYGMFPWLAARLVEDGHVVHRINLSHSGMDHGHGPFDEEAFEQDTYACGVEDILCVIEAINRGVLAGQGRGIVLMGHSRGGAVCLLTAGGMARDERFMPVVGIVGLSSAARLNRLSPDEQATLESQGRLATASSRTGQTLHVGRNWLQEQLNDPEAHDLPSLVGRIIVPVGLVHGMDDDTVLATDAVTLAQANPARVQVRLIDGGDHVFNTPNPFPMDGTPSPQLAEALSAARAWIGTWFG